MGSDQQQHGTMVPNTRKARFFSSIEHSKNGQKFQIEQRAA